MPATYITSDTHFGHQLMIRDGNRPWDTVEEMNEALIANWNAVVKPNDLIYHLGDIVMNRRYLAPCLSRLNGRKKLVKGNHDYWRLDELTPFFDDILGCAVFQDCIMTHVPVHPDQLARFKVNVHGHTHKNRVQQPVGSWLGQIMRGDKKLTPHGATTQDDPRYICVCVEQTDYRPVSYDEIRKTIHDRFG